MENPATLHGLNEFTEKVKDSKAIVRLRNGDIAIPIFEKTGVKGGTDCFRNDSWNKMWHLNGISMEHSQFDMMEIYSLDNDIFDKLKRYEKALKWIADEGNHAHPQNMVRVAKEALEE